MLEVPVLYIVGAFIPATMIAVLYYFDHSVASQLAQQKEFNLRKPPSFHYDLLLLGFMVHDPPSSICSFALCKIPLVLCLLPNAICLLLAIDTEYGFLICPWTEFDPYFWHIWCVECMAGYIMWTNWNSPIKWCHSTISNAHQKFSYIEAPGIHIHNNYKRRFPVFLFCRAWLWWMLPIHFHYYKLW